MIKLSSNFTHYTRINSNCNRYLKLTKQSKMKEMLEENMSTFFYHLRVRNSLLGTQNKQTTENFDMFLLCKDNKNITFALVKFIVSKGKKSTALKKFHYSRYYLVEKKHIEKNLDSESYCFFVFKM